MKKIAPATLKAMLADGGEIALLDVREAGQFGESHLLFATPLPYSRLEIDIVKLVPRRSARIVLCDDGDGLAILREPKRRFLPEAIWKVQSTKWIRSAQIFVIATEVER